jgi:hypothetical protein
MPCTFRVSFIAECSLVKSADMKSNDQTGLRVKRGARVQGARANTATPADKCIVHDVPVAMPSILSMASTACFASGLMLPARALCGMSR